MIKCLGDAPKEVNVRIVLWYCGDTSLPIVQFMLEATSPLDLGGLVSSCF